MTTAVTVSRRSVRTPFRVLAALLCLIFGAVAIGMAYMTCKNGVQALRTQDVLLWPGGLWLGRLFYAAARGKALPQDHWPFATAGVAQVYWLLFLCVSIATP
jgi:hypothetical protein